MVLCGAALLLACGSNGEGDHRGPRSGKGRLNANVNFANICPEFASYLLLPRDIDPGTWADISVSVHDPDDKSAVLPFEWRATSGRFSDLSRARTKYLCDAAGDQVLTVEVRDRTLLAADGSAGASGNRRSGRWRCGRLGRQDRGRCDASASLRLPRGRNQGGVSNAGRER